MRCLHCGKNFDEERYYGICPKCGAFHSKATPQEQHQQYHDQYDGGYRHKEELPAQGPFQPGFGADPGSVKIRERKEKSGNVFLALSIVIFVLVLIAGTFFSIAYGERQKEEFRQAILESEVSREEHDPEERFQFQDITLAVTEARTLAHEADLPFLPPDKKLVAVKIEGESDGEWKDGNKLSGVYIRCGDFFYEQISGYEFEDYAETYGTPVFDSYALCKDSRADGWLAFLVDEDAREFALCLEDRVDKDLAFLETIHSVPLRLEEEGTDE